MEAFNRAQVFIVLVHAAKHIDMLLEETAASRVSASVEIRQVLPYVTSKIMALNGVPAGLSSNGENVVRRHGAKRYESQ